MESITNALVTIIVALCCTQISTDAIKASFFRRRVESISRWDHSYYSGPEGSTFTLKCTVSAVGLFDIVRIAKRDLDSGEIIVISDKAWLKSPFSHSDRYSLDYSTIDADVVVTLTISNVEDGDSGDYTCGLHDNLDSTPNAEMVVKVGCFDKHVHYKGTVTNDCKLFTPTAHECQSACLDDAECTNFQLITEKFLDPERHGQCCFKKDIVGRLVNTRYRGLISGPQICPEYVIQ